MQASYALPTSESSRDGCGGNVRRITPVPLTATSPLPEVADSRPAAAAKAAPGAPANAPPAAGASKGGFNIAALAAAAGKQAAMQGKGH